MNSARWWIVLALLIVGCSTPGSRSGKSFDEIRRLIAGKSAGEIVQVLGEPDTRQEIFNSDERWIWWNYTYLDGSDFPPEVRGHVVHLEIVFRNPAPRHEGRRPYSDWRIDEALGVSFKLPSRQSFLGVK
jgi:hypothetical protein